jgi:hypothetical protein
LSWLRHYNTPIIGHCDNSGLFSAYEIRQNLELSFILISRIFFFSTDQGGGGGEVSLAGGGSLAPGARRSAAPLALLDELLRPLRSMAAEGPKLLAAHLVPPSARGRRGDRRRRRASRG